MAVVPVSVFVEELCVISEAYLPPIDDVRVKLYTDICIRRIDPVTGFSNIPFYSSSSFEPVTFDLTLSILQDHDQLRQVLGPWFERVGVDTSSIPYDNIVREVVECGVGAALTRVDAGESDLGTLCLSCFIQAVLMETDMDEDSSITTALAESASEFEMNNYGMVAARESSIVEMLTRFEVESGDESCVICLSSLEIGFEACRMPCSHGFHGDCIQKWLRQSRYCPICRFQMPTD